MSEAEAAPMLQEYEVMLGGSPLTLLLDKDTAERYGATLLPKAKEAAPPANKARSGDK